MDQILTDNVWKQIARQACKEKRKYAAIAYVSNDQYVRFGKGDILVCDVSDQAIRTGETSPAVLLRFFKAGAQLFSRPNLHAKIMVFGKNVLIGSCNLSDSSATSLREAALLSSRSVIRSQAVAFIHRSREEAEPIDRHFLERIRKIKVLRRRPVSLVRRSRARPLGNRTWVVRTEDLDPNRFKDEEKWVERAVKEVKQRLADPESEISWIRWTGHDGFRKLAKEGDTIIDMGSSQRGKRVVVSAPTAILKRQDRQKKWTRFYFEVTKGRRKMSWTNFGRNLKRLGIKNIKKNSTRELSRRDAALVDTVWEESE